MTFNKFGFGDAKGRRGSDSNPARGLTTGKAICGLAIMATSMPVKALLWRPRVDNVAVIVVTSPISNTKLVIEYKGNPICASKNLRNQFNPLKNNKRILFLPVYCLTTYAAWAPCAGIRGLENVCSWPAIFWP